MGFPSTPDTKTRSRNDAAAVASLLRERHGGHFMIWNLSEESYDTAVFDHQVRCPVRARACLRGRNSVTRASCVTLAVGADLALPVGRRGVQPGTHTPKPNIALIWLKT